MNKKKCFGNILVIVSLLVARSVSAEPEWSLVLNKKDIRVYNQAVAGSDLNAFKGVTIVNAGLEVILCAIRDIPGQVYWLADCKESKVIEKINEQTLLIYNVTGVPWPVSDRDALYKRTESANFKEGKVVFNFIAIQNHNVPEKEGMVRMKDVNGEILLKYVDQNHTQAEYTVKADPAGRIPATIANFMSRYIPYNTLMGLKEVVKHEKYIKESQKSDAKREIDNNIRAGFINP